ncbi:hypothetical protein [Desulfocastanea catecholica]
MNASKVIFFCFAFLFTFFNIATSATISEIIGEENLPPKEKRKVIGSWFEIAHPCTLSFEEVNSKTYMVTRCTDGSGGNTGIPLTKSKDNKYRTTKSNDFGEYFIIDKKGDLACYDNQGYIFTLSQSSSSSSGDKNKTTPEKEADSASTAGLDCSTIGYRYGYTATKALKGLPTIPAWDFVVPERCRNKQDTKNGITEGTKAAW